MNDSKIYELELLLKKIPGYSKRQISKTITYFLEQPVEVAEELFNAIKSLKEAIKKCEVCNAYNANQICEICQDVLRDKKLIVVENSNEIAKFEELNIFKGKYFVLESLYDIKNPSDLVKKNIDKLINLSKNQTEIILALSATIEGQFTMEYIKKCLRDKINHVNVYQLSMGIPMGASVEYIDPITLKQSLINKTKIS
ncbi:toprim domain-containing protein [Metamycoplasma spumans]|uniref:toprim domain-containing protein n=1 Tax=Metamycoplasma spumans TaxID=92406 RepID=UPI0034DD1CF4